MLALNLVVLAFVPGVRVNLYALLFGDILAVSRTDLAIVWGGGGTAAGIVSVAGGLLVSPEVDTPSAPSIVVVALTLFAGTRIRRPGIAASGR